MSRTIVKRIPHYPFKGEILYKIVSVGDLVFVVYLSQTAIDKVEMLRLSDKELVEIVKKAESEI